MRQVGLFLFLVIVFVLTGCSGPVNTDIAESINKTISEDNDIMKHISGEVQYSHAETLEDDGYSYIEFNLYADSTEEFYNLPDSDKYEVLKKITSIIKEKTDTDYSVDCGEKKACGYHSVNMNFKGDTYSFDLSGMSDEFELEYNGEVVYSIESDTESNETTDTISGGNGSSDITTSSSPSTSSSISKEAVYAFMKRKYDEITNYGENYVPETHDPLVARLASQQFGISEEEADQIYIDMEMGNY